MNYHNIKHDDQTNGDGLRVTLFVSGCEHHCPECQNPQTWSANSGIPFTEDSMYEICEELDKEHISGITLSGGDPLMPCNVDVVKRVIYEAVNRRKTVWVYTGYSLDDLLLRKGLRADVLDFVDVLIDGEYKKDLRDTTLKWRGSNQRVIDLKKTFEQHQVVRWCE